MPNRYRVEFQEPGGEWTPLVLVPDKDAGMAVIRAVRQSPGEFHAARIMKQTRPTEWKHIYEERW